MIFFYFKLISNEVKFYNGINSSIPSKFVNLLLLYRKNKFLLKLRIFLLQIKKNCLQINQITQPFNTSKSFNLIKSI